MLAAVSAVVTEPAPDPPRLVRVYAFQGANLFARGSVVAAQVAGRVAPSSWARAAALYRRALPAGVDPRLPARPPDGAVRAIEDLAGAILAWSGLAPGRVERIAVGLTRGDVALLAPGVGVPDLVRRAMVEAVWLLEQADGPEAAADPDRAATEGRRRLLALHGEADGWLAGSRRLIAEAAAARAIPWRPVVAALHVIQLGEGRHARRFDGTGGPDTAMLAVEMAADKRRAHLALRRAGLPVAEQRVVASPDELDAAIDALGLPLVLKPRASRMQQGVTFVFRREEAGEALAYAGAEGQAVLAESFLAGREYRFLVIAGRFVAALEQRMASVVGDGVSTVAELVHRENADPRRGTKDEAPLLRLLALDDLAERFLAARGLGPDTVLEAGRALDLHPLPMRRYGAPPKREITDRVHPDNRALAERAALVLGLDIAGLDLRMPDASRSWRAVGAGICEVNPRPNLSIHYTLDGDPVRDVAGLLVDAAYPEAARRRMVHVLVAGEGGLAPVAAAIADALRRARGWRVGTAVDREVDLEGWRPQVAARTVGDLYGLLVEDPTLDAAVYAVAPRRVVADGLGTSHLDVALFAPADAADRDARLARRIAAGAGARVLDLPSDPGAAARRVLAALAPASAAPSRDGEETDP